MSKLARTSTVPRRAPGVIKTKSATTPDTTNSQGRPAFSRDVKSELFTLAVTNLVGEETFHEKAVERDERFRTLVAQATAQDPIWTAKLLTWLRTEGNLRSAAIVGAVEYGRTYATYVGAGHTPVTSTPTPREVLGSVMQRADEPGEALGYWLGQYSKPLPAWLKKALFDGARKLYSPYAVFKYDGQGQPVRFGDVVEFSQGPGEIPAFKWLLDRRRGREQGDYGIEMLAARQDVESISVKLRRNWLLEQEDPSAALRAAGMTWESVSGWIQGPMDKVVWEALIPTMGYMALLRNLRNFDEAGVSDAVAAKVIARLTDPVQVGKSRQLPFRFLSAYQAAPSDRWKHPLGIALDLCFGNVPQLGGKTLVLIDTSGSMGAPMSGRSSVERWRIAALFGIALAKSQQQSATIVGYDHEQKEFKLAKGANVLAELKRFEKLVTGGATYTQQAIDRYQQGHQRIVVISDEQQNGSWGRQVGGVFSRVPESTHCYTINVAGYAEAHAPATGVRHGLAGLTDAVFKMMGVLEARKTGAWPWELVG